MSDMKSKSEDESWMDKLRKGEIPFTAAVWSKNGGSSGMKIKDVSLILGGKKIELITEEVEVGVDEIESDSSGADSAVMQVFPKEPLVAKIKTTGAGRVVPAVSGDISPDVPLVKEKKLKAENNNYFAVIRDGFYQKENRRVIDILFGEKGKNEGEMRSHICLARDGSGRFIRWGRYSGVLECEADYVEGTGVVIPKKVTIKESGSGEMLILEFGLENNELSLKGARFKSTEG